RASAHPRSLMPRTVLGERPDWPRERGLSHVRHPRARAKAGSAARGIGGRAACGAGAGFGAGRHVDLAGDAGGSAGGATDKLDVDRRLYSDPERGGEDADMVAVCADDYERDGRAPALRRADLRLPGSATDVRG